MSSVFQRLSGISSGGRQPISMVKSSSAVVFSDGKDDVEEKAPLDCPLGEEEKKLVSVDDGKRRARIVYSKPSARDKFLDDSDIIDDQYVTVENRPVDKNVMVDRTSEPLMKAVVGALETEVFKPADIKVYKVVKIRGS